MKRGEEGRKFYAEISCLPRHHPPPQFSFLYHFSLFPSGEFSFTMELPLSYDNSFSHHDFDRTLVRVERFDHWKREAKARRCCCCSLISQAFVRMEKTFLLVRYKKSARLRVGREQSVGLRGRQNVERAVELPSYPSSRHDEHDEHSRSSAHLNESRCNLLCTTIRTERSSRRGPKRRRG